jgi:hypothetical protein
LCLLPDSSGGPGVCLLDFDGDDDLDIYFTDRAPHPNRLYRNDGDVFSEVSEQVGAASTADGMGCLSFDYDGDGDVDLYLTNNGADQLLRNDGGTFSDVSDAAGISMVATQLSVSATAGDMDADGDLDLFVGHFADLTSCSTTCPVAPAPCNPAPNLLLENRDGTFLDVTQARGIDHPALTLAALFVDFDGDSDLDLYVGNDIGIAYDDYLYLNDGQGNFSDVARERSVNGPGTNTMGVDVGDFDLNGTLDMVISDFKKRPIRLYRCHDPALPCSNDVAPDGAEYVKWSIGFVDFDNDVDLDLFVSNGDIELPSPNRSYLYFNDGTGSYREHIPQPGDAIGVERTSRGAAFGDLDNDGDVDVVIANAGEQHQVLLNQGAAGHSLTVVLDSLAAGARVTVESDAGRLTEHALIGGTYAGSSDPRLHFGLGNACRAKITVDYAGGGSTAIEAAEAGSFVRVTR